MPRRKRTNTVDDLLAILTALPWWVGVLLAVVSYWALHSVAFQPLAAPTHQLGSMVTQTLWTSLATVGQYALPLVCLLGAGTSAWRRRERKHLVANVTKSTAANALDGMSWQKFEMLVGEGFRLQGYHVLETGGGGADGGVDLMLTKPGKSGGEKFLVQCKQWRAYKVGVDVVRELYGVMAAKGATGGFVVTSGRFTDEAVQFASGRNVRLIDGHQLQELLRLAERGGDRFNIQKTAALVVPPFAQPAEAKACPLCAKPMVRRTAKRGTNAGNEFWGCTGYPSCRGTHPIN